MARITVINDSSEFLDLMREVVGSMGHSMIGLEAIHTSIEEIVETRPDLIMVDLRLDDTAQEVSGWELLVLARSHRLLSDVPVILASADLWELNKRTKDLEQIAGVHVRAKPFDINEISELIERLLVSAKADGHRRTSSASIRRQIAKQ